MERLFSQGSHMVPEEGIFLMTLSVHEFSPASPALVSFPSRASLSFFLSLRLSARVKKNVRRRLPGSHSNFLLSRLSGEQPNAGLQKAAAARNTACIIEFAAVTYVNLSYLASCEEAFVLVKSVEPETRKKTDGISAAATASLEDNRG